jgi:hypothetical protein
VKHDALSEKARAGTATAIVAAVDERKALTSAAVRKPAATRPEARIVPLMPTAGSKGQDRRKEHRVVQTPRARRDRVKLAPRRRSDQSVPNDKSGKSAAIDQSEPTVASARNVLIVRGQKAPKSNKQKVEAVGGVDVASVVQTVPVAAMAHKMLAAMRRATMRQNPRGRGLSNLVGTSSPASRR